MIHERPSLPKVAVGAVIFRDQEVLLIKRGRAPFKGHWSIPGGKITFGETIHAALHREVLEETGVKIDILGLIDVFESVPQSEAEAHHYVMMDYACRYAGGEVQAGDDAEMAEFVSLPEAMARLAWDETRRAVQGALPFLSKMR